MSLEHDLVEQAKTLSNSDLNRPKQASLRRAVSAAYYALFHLLSGESVRLFVRGGDGLPIAARLRRTLNHLDMKRASASLLKGDLPDSIRAENERYLPTAELAHVCRTFILLQQYRHTADYDLSAKFTRSHVHELIHEVETAFSSWEVIRNTDEARIYLGCFLLWDVWKKPSRQ